LSASAPWTRARVDRRHKAVPKSAAKCLGFIFMIV
jgi:hypothetical protein